MNKIETALKQGLEEFKVFEVYFKQADEYQKEAGYPVPPFSSYLLLEKKLEDFQKHLLAAVVAEVNKSEVFGVGTVGSYEFQLDKVEYPDGTVKKKPEGYIEGFNQALQDIETLINNSTGV